MTTTADEVWQLLGELVASQKETDRRMQETDQQIKATDRQIQELGKQIGGLGKKFGSFTEGLALPSMMKFLHWKPLLIFSLSYGNFRFDRRNNIEFERRTATMTDQGNTELINGVVYFADL